MLIIIVLTSRIYIYIHSILTYSRFAEHLAPLVERSLERFIRVLICFKDIENLCNIYIYRIIYYIVYIYIYVIMLYHAVLPNRCCSDLLPQIDAICPSQR